MFAHLTLCARGPYDSSLLGVLDFGPVLTALLDFVVAIAVVVLADTLGGERVEWHRLCCAPQRTSSPAIATLPARMSMRLGDR